MASPLASPPSLFSSPLTIEQLIDVLNLLKRFGFPQRRWKELGLTLGLHKNTLDAIKRDNDITDDCLTECLSKWLSRADNVDSKGGATFDSLSDALKSMNENAAADKLDQEKCKAKAIDIFNTHHPLLSQSLSDPVSVAIMLQREGVITGKVLDNVLSAGPSVPNQREVLLAAIIVAIHSKYSSLQTFASVLCKFTGNVKLGTVIQRNYDKTFIDNSQLVSDDEADESSETSGSDSNTSTPTNVAPLYIPQYKSRDFDVLYAKFAKMFSNVHKVISKCPPPLEDLKMFIENFNSDLEGELSAINNLQGVMRLIRKNCCLINIVILEAVVEHFEIGDAQKYINDYKWEIDESCRSLSVDLCLNESFDVVRASPPLKCETATYVLGWEATEHKLKDVTDIVSKSSGKFVKVIKIRSTQSITITCSFPHSLTGALIIKLSESLELLIKNGLIKLTVGYCTIWKKQKIQEPLEEEVQEIKEQPHDTKEERVAKLEEKETEGATPQSVINQEIKTNKQREFSSSITSIISRKEHELQFNKLVDRFALELLENEKERLVHAYELSPHYYNLSTIQVMVALKMTGVFNITNPEGLLDIAEFLDRSDLIDDFTPKIEECKKAKPQKSSVMLPLNEPYESVDLAPTLDIAVKQIELGQASSEQLQKMCLYRRPHMKKQISERFETVFGNIKGVIASLHEMKEDLIMPNPPMQPIEESIPHPYMERSESFGHHPQALQSNFSTPRVRTPQGERRDATVKPPPPVIPVKPSKPTSIQVKRLSSDDTSNGNKSPKVVPLLPPARVMSLKSQESSPVTGAKPSRPPPPTRPSLVRMHQGKKEENTKDHYAIPVVPRNGTSASFSDSGFRGDWPEPVTKQKSEYQPLVSVQEEEQGIYSIPHNL